MEKSKILIDHVNKQATMFMLVLGGQVTLTSAFFRQSENLNLAFIAMALMLFSTLAVMVIAEKSVQKFVKKPKFRFKPLQKMVDFSWSRSSETIYLWGLFSALQFVGSLFFFGWFLHSVLS